MSKKQAVDGLKVSLREAQRDAWYAGADAVLEAQMKRAQKLIDGCDPGTAEQGYLYRMAKALYESAEGVFVLNPFRPETGVRPPTKQTVEPARAPTIAREPGTAEREPGQDG